VVKPDVGAPAATRVLVEERTGEIDLTEVGKRDPDGLPLGLAVLADRDDHAVGPVADVVAGAPGRVEGAVAAAGDDPVSDGE